MEKHLICVVWQGMNWIFVLIVLAAQPQRILIAVHTLYSKASMLNPSMPENFNPLRTVFLTGINPLWVDRKGIFWFLKQSDWFIVGILKSINARA
mmetsp:Transcript_20288/g.30881  ORF Transcript_20288/g.30881 Transcript_20288/m.30881 type:complete len:95 (-) Transcript_20288:127-411(-)